MALCIQTVQKALSFRLKCSETEKSPVYRPLRCGRGDINTSFTRSALCIMNCLQTPFAYQPH